MSTSSDSRSIDYDFICPVTRQPLVHVSTAEAESQLGGALIPIYPEWHSAGLRWSHVLLRKDGSGAFPVVDGLPILLVPALLSIGGLKPDRVDDRYAQLEEEAPIYTTRASRRSKLNEKSDDVAMLMDAQHASGPQKASFPDPPSVWIDAAYDAVSQYEAFRFMRPLKGRRLMQLGGGGRAAMQFLLAGATNLWLVTPILAEAKLGLRLAEHYGVADRLRVVVSMAEEMPFPDETFDAIYAGGVVHHTHTNVAAPELHRVLRPDGRLAAVDPWKTPVYQAGIRVFGKREREVHCKPMDPARVQPFLDTFGSVQVRHHGAFTRYLLLVANKFGLRMSTKWTWRVYSADEKLGSVMPWFRDSMGGSVVLLAEKQIT